VAVAGGYFPVLMELRQGISVIPQVTAEGQVRLQIGQRFDQPARPGAASIQSSYSTLLLTPGQWQPLGGIDVSQRGGASGLAGVSSGSRRMMLPLEVKVELH